MIQPIAIIIIFATIACVTFIFCLGYCITKYFNI